MPRSQAAILATRTLQRWLAPLGRIITRPIHIRGRQNNPLRHDAWYWGKNDPRFYQALTLGLLLQLLFLLLLTIPWRFGLMNPYGLPKGSGQENAQARQIVVQRIQRIKKERLIINPNSAVILYRPKVEDSQLLEQVDEKTRQTYQATGGATGRPGKGGGTQGGWPEGMENARVRFIRLQYTGGDWDQDMGVDADYNMLLYFRDETGFKIAPNTEAVTISDLRYFPKGQKPPFVFITGKQGMRLTSAEIKTLRWYCLEEGGMILADNGGGSFDSAFRTIMRQVFPELQWVDIANDDILYNCYYQFPNGAPPLWHHSGYRALGLKHNGRWIVFYHQGDMNDAWKTGHSGASPQVAAESYRLGINLIFYAFTQYYNIHHPGS